VQSYRATFSHSLDPNRTLAAWLTTPRQSRSFCIDDYWSHRCRAALVTNSKLNRLRVANCQTDVPRNHREDEIVAADVLDQQSQVHAIDHAGERIISRHRADEGTGRDRYREAADLERHRLVRRVYPVAVRPESEIGIDRKTRLVGIHREPGGEGAKYAHR